MSRRGCNTHNICSRGLIITKVTPLCDIWSSDGRKTSPAMCSRGLPGVPTFRRNILSLTPVLWQYVPPKRRYLPTGKVHTAAHPRKPLINVKSPSMKTMVSTAFMIMQGKNFKEFDLKGGGVKLKSQIKIPTRRQTFMSLSQVKIIQCFRFHSLNHQHIQYEPNKIMEICSREQNNCTFWREKWHRLFLSMPTENSSTIWNSATSAKIQGIQELLVSKKSSL
jgi:hypothetical protein